MHGVCDICKKPKTNLNKNRKTKQLVCPYCYRKHFHKRLCSKCGKMKSAAKRLPGGLFLCNYCAGYSYNIGEIGQCSVCEEIKLIKKTALDGKMRCAHCHNKKFRSAVCANCGKYRVINKKTENGPLCGRCYKKTLIGKCVNCQGKKIIHAKKHCAACYRRWLRRQKKIAS